MSCLHRGDRHPPVINSSENPKIWDDIPLLGDPATKTRRRIVVNLCIRYLWPESETSLLKGMAPEDIYGGQNVYIASECDGKGLAVM